MANLNGLITSKDVNGTANPDSSFFLRKEDPLIVDNLIANTLVSDTLNLNEGLLTVSNNGTVLNFNGNPITTETSGVDQVAVSTPLTLTGTTQLPVIGLDQTGLVQTTGAQSIGGIKTFTVLPRSTVEPTLDSQLVNKSYADSVASEWSTFPALGTLDMNGFSLNNVGDIVGTIEDIRISAELDINLQSQQGNVVIDARNFTVIANAPLGQDVSDSALTISCDNDIAITATDLLEITAGSMVVKNAMSMDGNKITSVADPTLAQDVATKAYVDGALPGSDSLSVVLTTGNSAGASEINMNGNKIVGCADPMLAQDVATKNYVDTRPAPTVPTLSQVLTAGNTASADIQMAGFDLADVNDITMSGLVPTITATNVAGNLAITSAATMNLGTAGLMTIASGGVLSLGGATHTTLENLIIDNSVITKVPGTNDLTLQNIATISNTAPLLISSGTNVNIGQTTPLLQDRNISLSGSQYIGASGNDPISIFTNNGTLSLETNTAPLRFQTFNSINEEITGSGNHFITNGTLTASPNTANAVLDVASITKGVLLPRMTTAQREQLSPTTGLLVYDTTLNQLMQYNGTAFVQSVLTNESNELLGSLSGATQHSLTDFVEIATNTLSVSDIRPLGFPLATDIGISGNLAFPGDITLRGNAESAGSDVIIDSIPFAGATPYDNLLSYDIATKKLYYQSAPVPGSLNAGTNISIADETVSVDIQQNLVMNGNNLTGVSEINNTENIKLISEKDLFLGDDGPIETPGTFPFIQVSKADGTVPGISINTNNYPLYIQYVRGEGEQALISNLDGVPSWRNIVNSTIPEGAVLFNENGKLQGQTGFMWNSSTNTLNMSSSAIQNASGVGGSLSVSGQDLSLVDQTGATLTTVSLPSSPPPPTLQSNTIYVNDGVIDIQAGIDQAQPSDVVMVSSGSYSGATVVLTGKSNIAIICPQRAVSQNITELSGGRQLTIDSTCTGSISINSLKIGGNLSSAGSGNHYFSNTTLNNGFLVLPNNTGNYFFTDCEIGGNIGVPETFAGVIAFIRCNFGLISFSLSNVSPLQVQFAQCVNLPTDRPTNCIYGSANNDVLGIITTNTDKLEGGQGGLDLVVPELRLNNTPGLSGQVLTTQGAGLPPIWTTVGGGGGGGVNSVVPGTNISVSGTTTDPVVNLDISSSVNMNTNNILNCSNVAGPNDASPGSRVLTVSAVDEVLVAGNQAILGKDGGFGDLQINVDNRVGSRGIYLTSTNNPVYINSSAGTTGQVLQSQGASLPPVWASVSGGGGVNSVTAGDGITVGGTATDPIVSNDGVLELTAGTGVSITGTKSNYTITATGGGGVNSVSAGTGITVDGTPSDPLVSNAGVIELTAGANMSLSGTKDNYTITSQQTIVGATGNFSVFNNSSTANTGVGTVMFGNTNSFGAYPLVQTFNNQPAGQANVAIGCACMPTLTTTTTSPFNNVSVGFLGGPFPAPTVVADIPVQRNTCVGQQALANIRTAVSDNVALGFLTGSGCEGGIRNTLVGARAYQNSVGTSGGNVCVGFEAGVANNGGGNTQIGFFAGRSVGGFENTMIGFDNGLLCGGNDNVYIGNRSCSRIQGSQNIILGSSVANFGANTNINQQFRVGFGGRTDYIVGDMNANTFNMTGLATFGDLALSGATVSPTAGASTGDHLRIVINGIAYKIELKADV